MDKEKGKANGKEKDKERTLDSIMKSKPPVPAMQKGKGKGKGNAAATTRLPRKLAMDSSNVPIAELLYRVKKKPPPRRLPDPTGAGVRAAIAAASGNANDYEREATSSLAMEHDKQAEEDHEEVEEDEEEDEDEQDTLFEVPPGVGDKSDSDGFADSEEEAFEGDDMSEDGLGLGPTPQEQETVVLSSSEDEARKVQRKNAKKRKGQAPSRSKSVVWTFFHKIKVPSKEGLMELKAQCMYCDNQYAYVQGGSTSNIFYPHIVSIKIALRKAMAHDDECYKKMGDAMMEKFEKYWDEPNNVMVLATILDPRYKMRYIEWCYHQMYAVGRANTEKNVVRGELDTLYEKFVAKNKQAEERASGSSAKNNCNTSTSMPLMDCEFQSFLSATSSTPSKSELRNYLDDLNEAMDPKFNLLDWWRVNAPRYPVLALMAKRFLTVPATSVSSESTFSTGGRVLDDYRSSLKPEMVEALVCGASYIKGAHKDFNVVERDEDEEDDVENIKLPKIVDVGDNNN